MTPDTVFFIGLGPAFFFGWWLRGLYEKEDAMTNRQPPSNGLFGWFSRGNRLVGLVVVSTSIALLALLYTFTSSQAGEDRDGRNLDCLTTFVADSAKVSAPRAQANARALDALRDYEQGYSKQQPSLSRAELKARFLVLYGQYEEVRADNPPLPGIRAYCEGLKK